MPEHVLQHYPFVTGRKAHCAWEFDLSKAVLRFLTELDPDYFVNIAEIHLARVEESECQSSAIALRSLYLQGLETLFAMLGALVQAPGAIPAWLLKYKNHELDELVADLQAGRPILSCVNSKIETWNDLSSVVHAGMAVDVEKKDEISTVFGGLWRRFAGDFLDKKMRLEYNSIKHGLRIKPGGFALAIGRQESPEVPCPPERMQNMGGSKFGSAYYTAEELDSKGLNFRIRQQSVNWNPQNMFWGAKLISLSLNNVIACLRAVNKGEREDISFKFLENPEEFDKPWSHAVGVMSFDFALNLSPNQIQPMRKEEILARYEKRTGENTE